MGAEKCQGLHILHCMAAGELVEKAQRIMVVHIGKAIEMYLLSCIFPIPHRILKKHDGKHGMDHGNLSRCWAEIWFIIHPSELYRI